jgi:hypothetical protein
MTWWGSLFVVAFMLGGVTLSVAVGITLGRAGADGGNGNIASGRALAPEPCTIEDRPTAGREVK